jgi:hypothetical protein
MSSDDDLVSVGSGILLGESCYDHIVKTLGSKPRIYYKFSGDEFNTKIYRQDGKLLAKDPKFGVRLIIRGDADYYVNMKITSFKGVLVCYGAKMIRNKEINNANMSDVNGLAHEFSTFVPLGDIPKEDLGVYTFMFSRWLKSKFPI